MEEEYTFIEPGELGLLQRRRLPAPGIVHKPDPFVIDGNNYLLKMTSDLRFLDSCEALTRCLGGQFGRNPFCLKKQDALDAVGGMSVMETGLTVEESAQREPPPEDTPFIERLRWASLVILSEEAVYGKFQTKEDGLGRSSGNVKKKKSASWFGRVADAAAGGRDVRAVCAAGGASLRRCAPRGA